MTYSMDAVRSVKSLTLTMRGLESKSITGAKKLIESSVKLKGIKGKLPRAIEKAEKNFPLRVKRRKSRADYCYIRRRNRAFSFH